MSLTPQPVTGADEGLQTRQAATLRPSSAALLATHSSR